MDQQPTHPVYRALRRVLLGFAAILFLIEDVLIRHLGPLVGRLAALKAVAQAEAWVARQSPPVCVVLLVLAVAVIYPFHFLAIPLFLAGRWVMGLAVILCAKLTAAGVVGRLLHVCHPRLMELAWFRRLDLWVTTTRARILMSLHQTEIWRRYREIRARWAASGWIARWRRAVRPPVA
jgi:hypothetical protein